MWASNSPWQHNISSRLTPQFQPRVVYVKFRCQDRARATPEYIEWIHLISSLRKSIFHSLFISPETPSSHHSGASQVSVVQCSVLIRICVFLVFPWLFAFFQYGGMGEVFFCLPCFSYLRYSFASSLSPTTPKQLIECICWHSMALTASLCSFYSLLLFLFFAHF